MRIFDLKFVAALLLITGVACEDFGDTPTNKSDLQYLFQEWNHSYEEEIDAAVSDILRPAPADTFPNSWYRKRYIFSANGEVTWLELSAVDAHYMRSGSWQTHPDDPAIISIFDENGDPVELASFRILRLGPNFLEIEPYSPTF